MNVDGKTVSLSIIRMPKDSLLSLHAITVLLQNLSSENERAEYKYRDSGFPLIAISSTDTAEFEEDSTLK
ncbi:MAG: hypothetical protein IPP52_12085 [Ignavibacteria bacterium]|nr:hypothetical protein [Ignavibacteria bacterium]